MDYASFEELVCQAEKSRTTISELVLAEQAESMEQSPELLYSKMDKNLSVMEESIKHGLNPSVRSTSGLTGGDSAKMMEYAPKAVSGEFMGRVIARAVAAAEYNAAMGKIVAAPTAGSCGIMPGILVSLLEEKKIERRKIVMSLFTAAAFGMVIANKENISGAAGGCQAECGVASGLTAAAVTEIMGGSPSQCAHACAIAIKNLLGLVCDPVAGLVEIPCIKRNAGGVSIACTAADMALSGVESKIPADEVISAMKEVGDAMPCTLRETAGGGLAVTPTGKMLRKQVFGSEKEIFE